VRIFHVGGVSEAGDATRTYPPPITPPKPRQAAKQSIQDFLYSHQITYIAMMRADPLVPVRSPAETYAPSLRVIFHDDAAVTPLHLRLMVYR
jgi:hypothetical protein